MFCALFKNIHTKLILILWRKRLFFLIIITILLCIWTWSIYNLAKRNRFIIKEYSEIPKSGHIIDNLISQANQVIKHQQKNKKLGSLRELKNHPKTAPVMENLPFEEERLKILQNQKDSQKNELQNTDYEQVPSAERELQYEKQLSSMGIPIVPGLGPGKPARPPRERIVHLDLKGAPPRLEFLMKLVPVIKELGGTGLLIEYEDMFPYSGFLTSLAAQNAYKPQQLKEFLVYAATHQLKIIPLVQTFGHLEFALKYEEFRAFREIPNSPQSICPSHSDTILFLQEMLKQIIEFHMDALNYSMNYEKMSSYASKKHKLHSYENFTHIHIGCDEVYSMANCDKCFTKTHNQLFLSHVINVGSFIKTKWPHLKTIIWDDMLRSITLSELLQSQIGNYVEPMIWIYYHDIYNEIKPGLWDIYSKVFPTAWAASAFKGAFGESLMIPPMQRHLENNMRWLAVIDKEGGRFSNGFSGLALTGWQRYDHFATLCELLPTGIPSLLICLSTVSRGYFDVDGTQNLMLKALELDYHPKQSLLTNDWIQLNQDHVRTHHNIFLMSNYIGSKIYKFILKLSDKLRDVETFLLNSKRKSAWMSEYNVRNNFLSPMRISSIANTAKINQHELTVMAKICHNLMNEVYDNYTINEFIEQNIYPIVKELNQQINIEQKSSTRDTWSRRPLPINDEFKSFISTAMNISPEQESINY